MLNIITNVIGSLRRGFSIVRNNLQLFLDFERSELVSGELVVKDKSPNTNNAKLYTGKALSFDGVNDEVDLGDIINNKTYDANNELTIACSYRVDTTSKIIFSQGSNLYLFANGSGNLQLQHGATSTILGTTPSNINRTIIVFDGLNLRCYIDSVEVVNTTITSFTTDNVNLVLGHLNNSFDLLGIVSDFQIWDKPWTTSDVTFDYNNPQHLVTDNAASSLSLSNLKGYWHLSEGAGDYAYNSAVALGSELVTNGTFDTDTDWVKGGGATISGGTGNIIGDGAAFGNLKQTNVFTIGKTYIITIDAVINSGFGLKIQDSANNENIGAITSSGSYTFKYTSVNADLVIGRRTGGTAYDSTIDNVSVKEVSVGEINGATWLTAQPTIAQLGLMDWAKSTVGSDEITLIQAPNNEGFDILGNALKLREHGFNLDGTGYGEVADDDTLDFGTGDFSLEGWLKYDFINSGSSYNVALNLGGDLFNSANITSRNNDKLYFLVNGVEIASNSTQTNGAWVHIVGVRESGTIKMYVDSVLQTATATSSGTITNALTKWVGRDSTTNRHYPNLVDEPKIYNRALSSDEIKQNYKAGLNKHKTGSSFSDDFSSDYGL